MPKAKWGTKRVCPETGKRFYDLGKNPVISPYTGKPVEVEASAKSSDAESGKPEEVEEDTLTLVEEADNDVKGSGEGNAQIDDELLEDDDEDNVSLDEIADVAADEDDS